MKSKYIPEILKEKLSSVYKISYAMLLLLVSIFSVITLITFVINDNSFLTSSSYESNNFFGDFHRLFAAQINKKIKIIEVEVNHRPRTKGKSKYGIERVFRVFIDLIFIKFSRNENSYFYTIGFMGLISFLLSLASFTYMVYLKIFVNK